MKQEDAAIGLNTQNKGCTNLAIVQPEFITESVAKFVFEIMTRSWYSLGLLSWNFTFAVWLAGAGKDAQSSCVAGSSCPSQI